MNKKLKNKLKKIKKNGIIYNNILRNGMYDYKNREIIKKI